jgi:hypothetical protein
MFISIFVNPFKLIKGDFITCITLCSGELKQFSSTDKFPFLVKFYCV